jgi:LIVCS family branched-chain amino acid:cation transporter
MTNLRTRDIIALGFMTFALFIGAGNIIFPPIVAQQAGAHVWLAAAGFLITAVGLPVITIMALSRVEGSIQLLSSPLGKIASLILTVVCYLSVGPLFATPRTATVSYEIGFSSYFGTSAGSLLIYSIIYFAVVTIVSLYPNKLLDTVGHFLAPLKIISLAILGIAAVMIPSGYIPPAVGNYISSPVSEGFVSGYLTMDTLGALVFGIVIIHAIHSRGVTDKKLVTRYAIIASLISGIGLTLVYLSLFKLGLGSHEVAPNAANGAIILHAYVQHAFGDLGSLFLTGMIFLACMGTAIGRF